jgi:hypothetical protein
MLHSLTVFQVDGTDEDSLVEATLMAYEAGVSRPHTEVMYLR